MDKLNLRWTGGVRTGDVRTGGVRTGGVETVAVEIEDGVDGVEVFQSDKAGGSETWKGLCYGDDRTVEVGVAYTTTLCDDELGDHFTAWVAAFSEFKVRIF